METSKCAAWARSLKRYVIKATAIKLWNHSIVVPIMMLLVKRAYQGCVISQDISSSATRALRECG